MYISPHFTMQEACKSATAVRLGIDNYPPALLLPSLKATAQNILEPARDHFGVPFSPSSFYRCMLLNRAINSSDESQHRKGQAVDFEIPGISNIVLAHWIKDNLDFDQLILEFYQEGDPTSGWVHASWTPTGRRNQVLTIGKTTSLGLPKLSR
ncbi:MAG: D-Ala-D-Ala carboxypeptidase family metallohydrolase [Parvibaculaceae bacterium]|nr:D-Ala-D-Ala carboxypeptidase family metallohydrolase [Parvibaculaceae bacterium]